MTDPVVAEASSLKVVRVIFKDCGSWYVWGFLPSLVEVWVLVFKGFRISTVECIYSLLRYLNPRELAQICAKS